MTKDELVIELRYLKEISETIVREMFLPLWSAGAIGMETRGAQEVFERCVQTSEYIQKRLEELESYNFGEEG